MKKLIGVGLAVLLAVTGFSSVFAQGTSLRKAVFIIAENDFQDDEFLQPLDVLEENGVEVTVASTTLGEAKGMNGAKVKPDILLKDVKVDDFNAVVFIGGTGAQQYVDDPLAHKLAQEAIAKDKILGAICLGPVILANAGVLTGKNATAYPTNGDKLRAAGVNYTAKPVEKDGKIITADGPKSAQEFGEELNKVILIN